MVTQRVMWRNKGCVLSARFGCVRRAAQLEANARHCVARVTSRYAGIRNALPFATAPRFIAIVLLRVLSLAGVMAGVRACS